MADQERIPLPETFHHLLREDGSLDPELTARELHDYDMLLGYVPKVYDHITGGRISKPNTLPEVVIAEADDRVTEWCEEAEKEACEERDAEIARLREELSRAAVREGELLAGLRDLIQGWREAGSETGRQRPQRLVAQTFLGCSECLECLLPDSPSPLSEAAQEFLEAFAVYQEDGEEDLDARWDRMEEKWDRYRALLEGRGEG